MRAYNLFRRKGSNALVCAVPEERSVPGFLTARRWKFDGHRQLPHGFDADAAAAAVRFNGFYLFADLRRERSDPEAAR
jgi:hypothetical protein